MLPSPSALEDGGGGRLVRLLGAAARAFTRSISAGQRGDARLELGHRQRLQVLADGDAPSAASASARPSPWHFSCAGGQLRADAECGDPGTSSPLSQPSASGKSRARASSTSGARAMASVPETMTAIEITHARRPRGAEAQDHADAEAGRGPDPDQGGGRRRQPARRAAAHGRLSAAARALAAARAGGRRRGRGGRRRRDALEGRRQGVRAGQRRRLCRVLPRRGAVGAADPGRPRHGQGGGGAGDLLHRLEQRVRARPAGGRRVVPGARRHQRHRHHGDPARQGLRRQGDRHGRLAPTSARRASSSAPTAPSTTRPRTSSRRSRRRPAARAST